jgi:hypothetical protein
MRFDARPERLSSERRLAVEFNGDLQQERSRLRLTRQTSDVGSGNLDGAVPLTPGFSQAADKSTALSRFNGFPTISLSR